MTRKSKALCFLFVLVSFFSSVVFAQVEELSPLYINYSLSESKAAQYKTNSLPDTLSLPFKDDFSKAGPYPDTAKWVKSTSVFVNTNFPLHPRTIGVATFDGLKSNGYPYSPINQVGSSASDTLTSKSIRMGGSLTPADSVYLSFYFQSKGLGGDAPEVNDVLMLDFFDVALDTFFMQKSISRPNNTTIYDTKFTCVMVPITDTKWLKDGFKIRFRNKSTACGSVDLWHIDNIYLGKNRNMHDTVLNDVAFAYTPKSLLKNYSAMPYEQYTGSANMGTTTHLHVRNNDTTQLGINITGYMDVKNNSGTIVHTQTNGSGDIFPYYPNGYCNVSSIADPSFAAFSYNNGIAFTDSTSFVVKHYIKTSAFDVNKNNDTVIFRQKFHNYFAYDDGTPEAGYQLNNFNAELAVRYDVNVKDTMRALDICFNPVIYVNQIEALTFRMLVWNDAGGYPGSVVYKDADTLLHPLYSKNINYPFHRYMFKKALVLPPGTYYVGLLQDDQQALNIGFDFNNDSQSRNFYNTSGSWATSSFQGSVMIRPIFGDSIRAIDGIKSYQREEQAEVLLYPNPVNDHFFIEVKNFNQQGNASFEVECYDMLGNKVFSKLSYNNKEMSTDDLSNGIYLVRVKQNKRYIASKKLLISR